MRASVVPSAKAPESMRRGDAFCAKERAGMGKERRREGVRWRVGLLKLALWLWTRVRRLSGAVCDGIHRRDLPSRVQDSAKVLQGLPNRF